LLKEANEKGPGFLYGLLVLEGSEEDGIDGVMIEIIININVLNF
jgi:hypothetical protein